VGKEALARVRRSGRVRTAKVLLETDEVIVRGDDGVRIPLKTIRSAIVKEGWLLLEGVQGSLEVELGPAASAWAQAILHPKTLLEKLGVKAGHRVRFLGLGDADLAGDARAAGATVVAAGRNVDILFVAADVKKDLRRLAKAESLIARDGCVWVVYPKAREDLREADVFAAGKAAGFTDVKVARYSATHTALKFVIPLARR